MANPYFQIEAGADKKRLDFPGGAAELFLGRSPECQLVIPSGAVSRRHARVHCSGNEITIEDLGSSNGTFVNGKRLDDQQPKALKDGDRVSLGSVHLTFVMPAAEPRSDATIAVPRPDDAAATVFAPKSAAPAKAAPLPPTAAKPPAAAPPTVAVPRAPAADPQTVVTPRPPAAAPQTVVAPRPAPAAAPAPPPVAATKPAEEPRRAASAAATVKKSAWASPDPAPEARFTPARVSGPSIVELAVIAAGSFLAVFAIGAALIRFLL